MQITLSAVVVLALAVSSHGSVVQLISGGLVLPPLSYTAQTVDLGAGLQGTVVAGQPARLVAVGPTLVAGASLIAAPTLIAANPLPAAIKLETSEPAVVEVEAAPIVPVVAAEG